MPSNTSCAILTPIGSVHQTGGIPVFIFVAQVTGSTETFYISKKRNQFTLIEVGALEATVMGTEFR
ncbi:MAG TPA: hypothetical protein VG817_05575, partial [Gemmatimonadales bacterium]|nr:hypothetical protein [Gemmatimonadales bacterium]